MIQVTPMETVLEEVNPAPADHNVLSKHTVARKFVVSLMILF